MTGFILIDDKKRPWELYVTQVPGLAICHDPKPRLGGVIVFADTWQICHQKSGCFLVRGFKSEADVHKAVQVIADGWPDMDWLQNRLAFAGKLEVVEQIWMSLALQGLEFSKL